VHFCQDDTSTANLLGKVALLDDPQNEWSIISSCINERHIHRFRTSPPDVTLALATEHDALVWKAVCHVIPPLCAHVDIPLHVDTAPQICADATSLQVRSSHSSGGVGLVDAKTVSLIAYVASVKDSLEGITSRLKAQDLEHWAEHFPACIPGLSLDWARVLDSLVAAESAAASALVNASQDPSSAKDSSHCQSRFTHAIVSRRLKLSFDTWDLLSKARLSSASGPGAGAFLHSPTGSGRLTSAQFRGALSCRLGLPLSRFHSAMPCNVCFRIPPVIADICGVHSSCCKGNRSGHFIRHNLVRDLVCAWCVRAGLSAGTEILIAGMKGDVVATGWGEHRNQTLVIDVTISNGLAPSIIGDFRAEATERHKRNTNLAHFCAARSDVYVFVPFAVEVLGRIGASGVAFIRQLTAMIVQRLGTCAQSSQVASSLYTGLSRTVAMGEDALLASAANGLYGETLMIPPPHLDHLDDMFFDIEHAQSAVVL
jgi:hypothetical protein